MSVAALTWAFQRPMTDPAAKAVLLALSDHADAVGRCWPSNKRLQLCTAYSERTIRDAIKRLEEAGALTCERQEGKLTIYRLNLEWAGDNPGDICPRQEPPPATVAGDPRQLPPPTPAAAAATPAAAAPEPSRTTKEPSRQPPTIALNGADHGPDAAEFAEWYAAYPRHVGRGQAAKAYRTARRKADAATLIAGARRAAERYAGADPQFIPYPATWLNGERWLDADEPQRNGHSRPPSHDRAGIPASGGGITGAAARVIARRGLA